MADTIVSVRMPSSLVQKLKELAKEQHYLDLSEELRSIIRAKSSEYKLPKTEEPKDNTKDELVRKLKQMIRELENG